VSYGLRVGSDRYFVKTAGDPADQLEALEVVFDLHDRLAAGGWIAVDFYDGCLIYDFPTGAIRVIDLDNYPSEPTTPWPSAGRSRCWKWPARHVRQSRPIGTRRWPTSSGRFAPP
jgi:hypothetical protein